jgi:hypothetical protein
MILGKASLEKQPFISRKASTKLQVRPDPSHSAVVRTTHAQDERGTLSYQQFEIRNGKSEIAQWRISESNR